jgi:protein-disulfide isomerase
MENNENLTTKQEREIRRQEKIMRKESGQTEGTRNRVLLWLGVLLVIGLVIFGMAKAIKKQPASIDKNLPVNILESVNSSDWIRGNENATTTLVEYGDFQCPACGVYYPYVKELEQTYGKDAKFIFRNFPLPQHVNARLASRAAEAAGNQGKFWEMHDMLYENQEKWSEKGNAKTIFTDYARTLKLDVDQFTKDLESKETGQKIDDDVQSGNKYGVDATPTFYLNNTKLQIRSFAEFKKLIEDEINKKS